MPRIAKSVISAAAGIITASATPATFGAVATGDLLAFYNAHAERFGAKPVKKFADRATAEKRALELAKAIEQAASAPPAAKPAKEPGDLSAAIANSWRDPAVAAARSARYAVKVKGEVHKSVRAAFDALGLDLGKHVAFRAKLVKEQKAEFEGHKFELVTAA
jgi:hypothetical protein